MLTYEEFLESKSIVSQSSGFDKVPDLNPVLFDFQKDIVNYALRRGRSAIFAMTGLGKTPMQVEWAKHVSTNGNVLILAPLAVNEQTVQIARDLLVVDVVHAEQDSDVTGENGIYITNYQKLHRFDAKRFIGIALDESSIIKHQDAKTRDLLIETFAQTPWKLCCTATPAPNDYMELGNHAEFLNVMRMAEMLSMFFVHDGGETQKWRLKGHAADAFWKWVASWAVSITKPSDLGYSDDGFDLPPLRYHVHRVAGQYDVKDGYLFAMPAISLDDFRSAKRGSIDERCKLAAEIVGDKVAMVWGELNAETDKVAELLPNAVQVSGSDTDDHKAKSMLGFASGEIKQMISKASLCGFGMNWQNCDTTIFLSISHSWERFFQAVRRFWRFGQKKPVNVHIIISDLEEAMLKDLWRKEKDAQTMSAKMIECVKEETKKQLKGVNNQKSEYKTRVESGKGWTAYMGDCVETVGKLESNTVDYSVFSPPFSSLYTYSNSDRDMGNCTDDSQFEAHFRFLVHQLFRVIKPGREVSFHCMNLPTSKQHHGYIGIRDFRGELIRMFIDSGFIYHSEVCIWKDPVTAMQRTKAIGLLHKQLKKDSCISRQGIPDYLVTMRKPGENPDPVTHTNDTFPVSEWQKIASPVWMDINPSDTLQYRSARENNDERHICPLQLEVIRRALRLWTNPNDLVLSPFMGIGSEGYVALEEGRRFVGVELKESYYKQSVANLKSKSEETRLI